MLILPVDFIKVFLQLVLPLPGHSVQESIGDECSLGRNNKQTLFSIIQR